MLKKIWNLVRQDAKLALRDNIVLYVIISPLLLAFLARIFLPGLENNQLQCAVLESVDEKFTTELKEYFSVEVFTSHQELERRILRPDDVAGFIPGPAGPVLLLGGNETQETREALEAAYHSIMSPEPEAGFTLRTIGEENSQLKGYIAIFLCIMASLLGGMTIGFNMVEEYETGVIRALATSPLRLGDYMLARSVFVMIQGLVIGLGTTLILFGFKLPYSRLIPAFLAATPLSSLSGFLIAAFATTQISAIGSVKLIMPFYLTIPLIALFLPVNWHWVFFIFPNYWMFSMFHNIFIATPLVAGYALSLVLMVAAGCILNLFFIRIIKRKFNLRLK